MSKSKQSKSDVATTGASEPSETPSASTAADDSAAPAAAESLPDSAPPTPAATPPADVPPAPDGVVELGRGVENEELGEARWTLTVEGREWADLVATSDGIELVHVEGGAPILYAAVDDPRPVADPFAGAVPMELHVSGAAWNNDHVRLIRCATSGDLADQWMVARGDRLVLNDGKDQIAFKSYRHLADGLQKRVRFPLEKALEIARDAR